MTGSQILELFWGALSSILTGFASFMVDVFESVIGIFFDQSGDTPTVTVMGYILFLGVVVSIFWFVLSWIRRLLTVRARG